MKRITKPVPPILPDDPATNYAVAVQKGEVIAGPHVRAACKRHLADLKRLTALGYTWDIAEVLRVIDYFRLVLTVEIEHPDGVSEAVPFILQPWQCFVLGCLFGWKDKRGLRRFRRAYVEIAKGNGKTPMAAGIGFYMMTATKKKRAEVYSAATDRDQAAILFRDAIAMWERTPELSDRLVSSGDKAVWQLTDRATSSFFKPISSEKRGKSGIRPYCALIDEIHEHPDDSVIEMLRAGTKGNQQALILEITNAGFDRESVCWKEHEYTIKVCNGDVTNESWFGFITSLDEGDDPFNDEVCWIKANPNLGVSIQLPYIREQVTEAKGMPSKEALVRRLNFCEWTDAAKTWVGSETWKKIEANFSIEDYAGEKCCLGLDMSFTQDLTALAYVFETGDNTFDAFVDYWTPGDTMIERAKRDGGHYPLWAKQDFLFAPDGKVINLEPVAARIVWALKNFQVEHLAYDRYRHRELEQELNDLSCAPPLIEHPQGFRRGPALDEKDDDGKRLENMLWMPGSFDKLETAIIEGRIRIAVNPVTRWNVSCVAVRDDPAGTGNRVFDKKKATGRIDGVVALAMALGAASLSKTEPPKSVYELIAGATPAEPEKVVDPWKVEQADNPVYSEARRRWDQFRDAEDYD